MSRGAPIRDVPHLDATQGGQGGNPEKPENPEIVIFHLRCRTLRFGGGGFFLTKSSEKQTY